MFLLQRANGAFWAVEDDPVNGVQSEVQAPDDAPASISELESMSALHPRPALKGVNAQPFGWRRCDQDRESHVRPLKAGSAAKRVPGSWRQLKTGLSHSRMTSRMTATYIAEHSTA